MGLIPWSNITVWRPQEAPFLDSKTNQLAEQVLIPSHNLHVVNPTVQDTGNPGTAIRNAQPVKFSLKPEVAYRNKRRYPIKLEAKKKKRFATSHVLILKTWPLGASIIVV